MKKKKNKNYKLWIYKCVLHVGTELIQELLSLFHPFASFCIDWSNVLRNCRDGGLEGLHAAVLQLDQTVLAVADVIL